MKGKLKRLLLGLFLTFLSVVGIASLWGWIGICLLVVCLFGFAIILHLLKFLFPNARWTEWIKLPPEEDNRPFEERFNDDGIFTYSENGFIVNLTDGQQEIKWSEINTIFGYKVDLFAIDSICVDVFCDNDKGFTIDEETKGWFQFRERSKERFSSIDKKWEVEIAVPAFETKLTLVYDRENRSLEQAKKEHYKD